MPDQFGMHRREQRTHAPVARRTSISAPQPRPFVGKFSSAVLDRRVTPTQLVNMSGYSGATMRLRNSKFGMTILDAILRGFDRVEIALHLRDIKE